MYKVVAIGDIIADIITDPLRDFTLGDRQFKINALKLTPGGNATNFILGVSNLGLKSMFVGSVGDCPFGNFLINYLNSNGVETHVRVCKNKLSGITYALTHSDGTRQLITYVGANQDFVKEDINLNILDDANHLHRSGYWWTPRLAGKPTADILKYALEKGLSTSVDVATDPDGWTLERRETVYEILEYTTIFFGNEHEITSLAQNLDLEEAVKFFQNQGVEIVAVHQGSKGSSVYTKDRCIHAPAFKIHIQNPTGSGDIYNAGFIFGYSRNWELDKIVKFANACSAYHIENLHKPYPTFSDVCDRFGCF